MLGCDVLWCLGGGPWRTVHRRASIYARAKIVWIQHGIAVFNWIQSNLYLFQFNSMVHRDVLDSGWKEIVWTQHGIQLDFNWVQFNGTQETFLIVAGRRLFRRNTAFNWIQLGSIQWYIGDLL